MKRDVITLDGQRTGAAGTLNIGGRTLLLNPPTEAETLTITLEARRKLPTPISLLVNDPSFSKLPESVQSKAIETAARAQVLNTRSQDLDATELAQALLTPSVLAFAVWICARGNHKGITLEEVQKLVTDQNVGEVFVAYSEAAGLKALEQPEKNSGGGAG